MSVRAALAAVRRLRSDQREFLRYKKLRASMPAAHWSASLQELLDAGRLTLPASRRCMQLAAVSLVGAVLALVLGAKSHPLPGVMVMFLGAGIAAWALRCHMQLLGAGQGPFLTRVERFLLPCVRLLERDMDVHEPLRLEVDLGPSLGEQVGRSERQPGQLNPRVRKVEERRYRKVRIAGAARLADGSLLSWTVVDRVRVLSITKRSASGKLKLKRKSAMQRLISARLGLRADAWSVAGGAAAGQGPGVRLTATEKERRLVLKVKRTIHFGKSGGAPTTALPDRLDDLLDTIGSLFAQARRRPPAAAAPGRTA